MRTVVSFAGRLLLGAGLLLLGTALSGLGQVSDGDNNVKFSLQAAATFNTRCTACHTFGRGVKVGPDLKDVTKRRKREWLLKFVRGSSLLIKSGDPTAAALFSQFKQQRMPDWVDLSDQQVSDILDFITVGGPDIKPADERNAEAATSAETETGRRLFYGEMPLRYGAQACATCHSVSGGGLRGGGLGPNLSDVYVRYHDLALTHYLRHPCFAWERTAPAEEYLAPKESFALKAFLRSVSTKRAVSALPARPDDVARGGQDR
jgi:cytochrome c2